MKNIKKIAPLILSVSMVITQMTAPLKALAETNNEIEAVLLDGTRVTKLKWNGSSWANGLEFEEIDKYSSTPSDKKYAQSINAVNVNSTVYKKDSDDSNQNLIYEVSASGLRIKAGAFIEGENVVLVKAEGY